MSNYLRKIMMNCDYENLTPLTFTAEAAGSTVKLTITGSPTVEGLQYRIGTSGGWSPYTIDTVLTLANVGDCVQFQNTLETLGTSNSNYAKFVMTGKIAATGNCMSMLNFGDKMTAYAFNRLFEDCSSLTSAPELPATTLADYCYQYMFRDCSSLTSAPELPANTLAAGCYGHMFTNCTSLVNAPKLSATSLGTYCYSAMFQGCSSLVNAPELPATTLANYCYQYMFQGCTKLNHIKVNFSSWIDNTTNNWVVGVSSTGVFNAPSDLPVIVGDSNIPAGWTITNN